MPLEYLRAMTITLTKSQQAFVRAKVESGQYASEADVMREALKALKEREAAEAKRLAWLRAEIGKGIDDANAGRAGSLDIEEMIRRGRERHRKQSAA
jgi:antitoxin ParD1/3/4